MNGLPFLHREWQWKPLGSPRLVSRALEIEEASSVDQLLTTFFMACLKQHSHQDPIHRPRFLHGLVALLLQALVVNRQKK